MGGAVNSWQTNNRAKRGAIDTIAPLGLLKSMLPALCLAECATAVGEACRPKWNVACIRLILQHRQYDVSKWLGIKPAVQPSGFVSSLWGATDAIAPRRVAPFEPRTCAAALLLRSEARLHAL